MIFGNALAVDKLRVGLMGQNEPYSGAGPGVIAEKRQLNPVPRAEAAHLRNTTMQHTLQWTGDMAVLSRATCPLFQRRTKGRMQGSHTEKAEDRG